ncbi:MAG TPA: GNAT family protein [Solimonas sp.]|nr:GNAT family protein [Solimonas sp.]
MRALTRDDAETLRQFVNDPDVMQFSNNYAPIHEEQQQRWLQHALESGNATWFGLCDRSAESAPLVGTCCLVDLDPIARSAELRIRIGRKEAWGRKLGGEACALLLRYGFEERNLERIWLRVFANNPRAIRMYESLGMVHEGTWRRAAFIGGAWLDIQLMALLRSEWRGLTEAVR